MNKHQKHTAIAKRDNDNFAPNEVAFLGANCSVISNLVHQISQKLTNYKLAYIDASHAKDVNQHKLTTFTFHVNGNLQTTTVLPLNKYEQRIRFSEFDYLFINGNHFEGAKQILILDPEKEASVLKRLNQLTKIQFIIKLKEDTAFFPFLEEKYPHIKNITTYTIDQIDKISSHVYNLIQEKIAPVKGLVLVGGKSTRMGTNKSALQYYDKPQKEVVKKLLENNLLDTYFSVANSSTDEKDINDTFLNLGPFGGICSAFQKDPNAAWLVLPIDVPFVDEKLIKLLLEKRNPSKIATAIKAKNKDFPEPLIAIYEPKAYSRLLQYLAQGYSCPRKMLINADVEIVEVADQLVRNVNTFEEYKAAKKEINL
ncbi:NTP transferase domain-containing protein [Tenacibaculum sp. UWU-22]|uniref:NTP transferase domain-containing protein n=1 Tax=Tenacibaculum sp. UWU-22 TaxID=3234187 RepID=UPI0034DB3706